MFFRNLKTSKTRFKISLSLLLAVIFMIFACIFYISPGLIFAQEQEPEAVKDIIYSSTGDIFIKDIDTAGFPKVGVYINFKENSRIAFLNLNKEDFKILENDQEIKDFSLEKIGEINEPISTVLVIDTSGSMKGEPIDNAKTATSTFIDQMSQIDKISIIGFADSYRIFSSFTSEKQLLLNSISKLEANGETALFDGILKGLEQFDSLEATKHKYLIVLSDGTDTVSNANTGSVIESSTARNVTIYSIALVSKEYNPEALLRIAESTGGELLTTADSNDLKNLYNKISEKIRNQYRITYQSMAKDAKEYTAVISVNKAGITDDIKIEYTNPFSILSGSSDISNNQSLKAIARIMFIDIWWIKLIIYILIFVSVTIFIYVISTIMVPNKQSLKSRTDYFLYNIGQEGKDVITSEKKSRFSFRSKAVGPGSKKNGKKGFVDLFDEKLKNAGMTISGGRFIMIHLIIVAIATLIVFLFTKNLIVTLAVVMITIFLPFLFINFKTSQKIKKFNEQLPDTLQLIEGALKAGYSFNQSLYMVVKETKPPISEEFTLVLNEVRMGSSDKAALENMAKRINSELFDWVVLAINIQREVGGNLAEIMDIIANTIREKERVLRQIKALTAEGRLSAYILIGLPIILGIILSIMNRAYISVLFTTRIGFMMLGLAAGLMIVGIWWIIRIVKIQY